MSLIDDLVNLGEEDGAAPPSVKPRVVVVDDDELVLMALRVVLRGDFDVRCFSDPAEGAAAGAASGVAAVILDIKMPIHDGFWVFRKIRERSPDVPIVFN